SVHNIRNRASDISYPWVLIGATLPRERFSPVADCAHPGYEPIAPLTPQKNNQTPLNDIRNLL
ncbi:MAG: hypothetical protein ACYDHM_09035, partial [Acidiferrobacterales bacterium]